MTCLALLAGCAEVPADAPERCPPAQGIAVQVLGSGGPIADDNRASSGYLVWLDGRARVMIDAGTGSLLRFAESGARFEDLDFVGLSHFHTDHSADFPALLKSGNFSNRHRPLRIAGPGGSSRFPGLDEYLAAMLDPDAGSYRYLSGYLDGSRGLALLQPHTIESGAPDTLLDDAGSGLRVDALRVPHGIVPAVAFRVVVNERTLVFGSDQTLTDPAYTSFAREADLLVAHMVIPESATGAATQLHAKPSAIGAFASDAEVGGLLLSHLMQRSLRDLDGNLRAVRARYDGETLVATDLACIELQ